MPVEGMVWFAVAALSAVFFLLNLVTAYRTHGGALGQVPVMAFPVFLPVAAVGGIALMDRSAGWPGWPAWGYALFWLGATVAGWWATAFAGTLGVRNAGLPEVASRYVPLVRIGPHRDCYVMVKDRSEALVGRFLHRFLPKRYQTSGRYEVVRADGGECCFRWADDLIAYCCADASADHPIYWFNATDGAVRFAMVIFKPEGPMILGLSVEGHEFPGSVLDELQHVVGGSEVLVTNGAPPRSAREFELALRASNGTPS